MFLLNIHLVGSPVCLYLFLLVPRVGLWSVIAEFLGHTHLVSGDALPGVPLLANTCSYKARLFLLVDLQEFFFRSRVGGGEKKK